MNSKSWLVNSSLLCVLVITLFSGCTRSDYILFEKNNEQLRALTTDQEQLEPYRYKIRVNDRISVLFYDNPELGTRKIGDLNRDIYGILVDSKGYAKFPLLGAIKVTDYYQEDLASHLETLYSEYILNPQINIDVINKRVIVLGEVKKPGVIQITNETISLFEVLSRSGGISYIGERNGVIILRGDMSNPQMSIIDLTDMRSIMKYNTMLQPYDIVYVVPNLNLIIEQGLTSAQVLNLLLGSAVNLKILTNF